MWATHIWIWGSMRHIVLVELEMPSIANDAEPSETTNPRQVDNYLEDRKTPDTHLSTQVKNGQKHVSPLWCRLLQGQPHCVLWISWLCCQLFRKVAEVLRWNGCVEYSSSVQIVHLWQWRAPPRLNLWSWNRKLIAWILSQNEHLNNGVDSRGTNTSDAQANASNSALKPSHWQRTSYLALRSFEASSSGKVSSMNWAMTYSFPWNLAYFKLTINQ